MRIERPTVRYSSAIEAVDSRCRHQSVCWKQAGLPGLLAGAPAQSYGLEGQPERAARPSV
jgi:hypothetical protein